MTIAVDLGTLSIKPNPKIFIVSALIQSMCTNLAEYGINNVKYKIILQLKLDKIRSSKPEAWTKHILYLFANNCTFQQTGFSLKTTAKFGGLNSFVG